jgi:hypothetical protein
VPAIRRRPGDGSGRRRRHYPHRHAFAPIRETTVDVDRATVRRAGGSYAPGRISSAAWMGYCARAGSDIIRCFEQSSDHLTSRHLFVTGRDDT